MDHVGQIANSVSSYFIESVPNIFSSAGNQCVRYNNSLLLKDMEYLEIFILF